MFLPQRARALRAFYFTPLKNIGFEQRFAIKTCRIAQGGSSPMSTANDEWS